MDGSATIDELKAFGASVEEWQEKAMLYALNYTDTVKNYYRQFLRDHRRGILMDDFEDSCCKSVVSFNV
jgi:hypothetical protein